MSNRRLLTIFVMVVNVILSSCSNEEVIYEDYISKDGLKNTSHQITKNEALSIASKVLGVGISRNSMLNFPEIQCVLNESNSRSDVNLSDTLAYVLNYPDNGGFVIVSADNRIYPVLGYSNEGNFSLNNEIANKNFIEKIGAYIESADDTNYYDVSSDDFVSCVQVNPASNTKIGQRTPWDKYVIQVHPGCPVGCTAVATALVLSHSKETIEYHGSKFYLKSIISAINAANTNVLNPISAPKKIVGGTVQPTYTYAQAVDSMARLLYYVAEDIETVFTENSSYTYPSNAFNLCKDLGYTIPTNYASYKFDKIIDYLCNDYIVFLVGYGENYEGGHAWVGDGCSYCVDENGQMTNAYIHCDWGWNGEGNGYFNGSVFNVLDHTYYMSSYFAVKREWKNL